MGYTWQYYDLVLAGIAASLLAGVAVGYATALSMEVAVIATCLLALVVMGHGLFVNGPVDAPADLADPVDLLE
ncbi:hypothetical protein [Halomarina ordinaria]|uniref:Uncharacterized protein n=1 Tax=Halomarina ordinaria TaxID=3033939 RepID=A0ABD5UDC4_9EURY|nr:hypothetical protein [Halomarina sp. PSRA2]